MRTLSGPATTRVGGPFPALYSVRRYVTSMPETTAPPPSRATQPSLELLDDLVYEVETVFHGKREVVRLALACVLARGHVLFEDVPGVGKTTLAHALAKTLGAGFRRIQFTADLLPSDVLGVSVYNPKTLEFETRRGPLFTNVVLADEINRAPPRTQSGLLEAMQEGSVTIDGETHELPKPFVVMATQNPLEHHGTYPLPEAQLDRFIMKLSVGYPGRPIERAIIVKRMQRMKDEHDVRALAYVGLGQNNRVVNVDIQPRNRDRRAARLGHPRIRQQRQIGRRPR